MSPPPSKDWWLAAALTSAAVPGVMAQQAPAVTRPDAVVTTVTRPGTAQAGVRHVQISGEAARGQKLVTDGQTAIHVLFADQSAITVAPNSEVVVQQYSYDDRAREGSIVVELTQGMLRMVGGFITKKKPALVTTRTATVGIRGGITIVGTQGDQTSAGFLFGDAMTFTQQGQTASIFRPGFGIVGGPNGMSEANRSALEALVKTLLDVLNTAAPGAGGSGGDGSSLFENPAFVGPMQEMRDRVTELLQLLGSPGPGNQS